MKSATDYGIEFYNDGDAKLFRKPTSLIEAIESIEYMVDRYNVMQEIVRELEGNDF